MHPTRPQRCLAALLLSAAGASTLLAQESGEPPKDPLDVLAPKPEEEQPATVPTVAAKFPPAANLEEALAKALDAIRQAEKQGSNYDQKLAEASFYTQAALSFDQNHPKANFIAARISILLGRPREAFTKINDYIATPEGNGDWEAFKILGDLHYAGGYYEQAITKYRRAITLNPAEARTYVGLCRALGKRGQRREAIETARTAVEKDPTLPEAYDVSMSALMEIDQYGLALEAARSAISHTKEKLAQDPQNLVLIQNLRQRRQNEQTIIGVLLKQNLEDPTKPTAVDLYKNYVLSVLDQAEANRMLAAHQAMGVLEKGLSAGRPPPAGVLLDVYVDTAIHLDLRPRATQKLEEYAKANPSNSAVSEALARLQGSSTEGTPPTPAEPEGAASAAPPSSEPTADPSSSP